MSQPNTATTLKRQTATVDCPKSMVGRVIGGCLGLGLYRQRMWVCASTQPLGACRQIWRNHQGSTDVHRSLDPDRSDSGAHQGKSTHCGGIEGRVPLTPLCTRMKCTSHNVGTWQPCTWLYQEVPHVSFAGHYLRHTTQP